VLRDVADGRLTPPEREGAARLVAFLLHEKEEVAEATATEVLSAATRAFDVPMAVLTLVLGLRDTLGDPKKLAECTTRLAHQALAARHREAFLVLVELLVGLGDFKGDLPPTWANAFVRARADRSLRDRMSRTTEAYGRRFGRSFFVGTRLVREGTHTGGAS